MDMAPTDATNVIAAGTSVRRESSAPMRPATQPASRPRNANGTTKKMPVPSYAGTWYHSMARFAANALVTKPTIPVMSAISRERPHPPLR